MSISGLKGGQATQLNLAQLHDEAADSHKMRFRYYQNIEGTLRIPEDFQPAKILIKVKPTGKKLAPVEETFEWSPVS
jgi:hypothetical protein